MKKRSSLSPRHQIHPVDRCSFCGATEGLYRTYLYTTHSLAMVCEDPVPCLRRRHSRKTDAA